MLYLHFDTWNLSTKRIYISNDIYTAIIIEHNLDVIRQADWIIDMGPEGGRKGGQILSAGTPAQVAKSKKGYTPKYLKF